MRSIGSMLAVLGLVSIASASSYTREARTAAIGAALAELGRDHAAALTLQENIRAAGRSRCRGSAQALVVRCYIEVGRAACDGAGPGCAALADVIVTNHLAESAFVSDGERYQLMSKEGDFRAALDALLDRRYAELAVDLALSGEPLTAAVIDDYCLERAKRADLPWQRCVAALVWFAGPRQAEVTR